MVNFVVEILFDYSIHIECNSILTSRSSASGPTFQSTAHLAPHYTCQYPSIWSPLLGNGGGYHRHIMLMAITKMCGGEGVASARLLFYCCVYKVASCKYEEATCMYFGSTACGFEPTICVDSIVHLVYSIW